MPKNKDLSATLDLITLTSLDLLPEMSAVLADRAELSAQLDALETRVEETRRYISFCSNGSRENPAMFTALIVDGRERLAALEVQQKQLRDEASVLDAAVNQRRQEARQEILPAIRALGLPAIDGRIAQLEAISMVQRLLGKKSQQAHAVRQLHVDELSYLRRLRDVLTAEDPS